MGKRVPANNAAADHGQHVTPTTRSIRKRRRGGATLTAAKSLRLSSAATAAAAASNSWHENDDEDSSSNDAPPLPMSVSTPVTGLAARNHQASSKHANNSSILLSSSFNTSAFTASATAATGDTSINESPKPVYTLRPSVVNGTILYDLTQKPWRLGRPTGKGNFGEIFLASDNISIPVTNENAKFVVKIEPHSNGPLFVEIHCLINTAKKNPDNDDKEFKKEDKKAQEQLPEIPPTGIPDYIASGSHYFGDARYRFLVLQRFDRDLHSLIRNCRVHQKSVLTLAIQIVNVLERLHDKGYCHNDVKAQNLMISRCKYLKQKTNPNNSTNTNKTTNGKSPNKLSTATGIKSKYEQTHDYDEKQQTTDSGNSSEQEANDNDEDYMAPDVDEKSNNTDEEDYDNSDDDVDNDDEDFDDGETTNSNNSNSIDAYKTPLANKTSRKNGRSGGAAASAATGRRRISARVSAPQVEYSGSNPVRSCRRQKRNSIYEEMVNSHYLRPAKRVSYSEFFSEDGIPVKAGGFEPGHIHIISSDDDDSEEFVPKSARRSRRSSKKFAATVTASCPNTSVGTRLTRRQEKLLASTTVKQQQQPKHHNRVMSAAAAMVVVPEWITIEEERIFLIDFGLASKFMDNGVHRPFCMDQRRAHDGTLEFTSRDAHMGAHSRRSDMECLGYNLIFWSQGYLPWKEAATHQQQEKVHRAKEYLMTDVREMLVQIYGKQVPNFLGEFLQHVGQLAFHERPDYAHYRRLFEREFQQLLGSGVNKNDVDDDDILRLDSREIMRTCVRVKEEIENNKQNDLLEMNKRGAGGDHNHVWSIMKNLSVGVGTPLHERILSNRVSPKNLRSMSDKKSTIKKKKFSWAEILSQDPDQIARERAEKEFDREEESNEVQQSTVRHYEGKPTYAIREIELRLIAKRPLLKDTIGMRRNKMDNVEEEEEEAEENEEEDEDVEMKECEEEEEEEEDENTDEADVDEENEHELPAKETFVDDDQDDEEETETDSSEVSEQEQQTNGRITRRAQNTRITKTTTTASRKKSTPSKTLNDVGGGKRDTRGGNGKRISTIETTKTIEKRSNNSKKTRTTKSSNGKRGNAMRKGISSGDAASAAGEIEHTSTPRYLENRAGEEEEHHQKPPKRRTRRCLLKTDKTEGVVRQRKSTSSEDSTNDVIMLENEEDESEGSNSNFSPDVHGLFNVWKKINNETIYFRGSKVAAAAARHSKK